MRQEDQKDKHAPSVLESPQMHGTGAYASANVMAASLSAKAWNKEKEQHDQTPWSATPGGRLAIRCFSRGVLGCLFFTWGGMKAIRDLRGYDPAKNPQNFLQGIAKIVDVGVGRPIEWTVNAFGGDGRRAVYGFRPTRDSGPRSLGAEAVAITFDFAMASVGDSWGRSIAAICDPSMRKEWMKDGHLDLPLAVKELAKNTWRVFSYNQMEDWAVGVTFYPWQIRAQRNLIDKFSPGFRYDSDRQLNGGSFKLDDQRRIVGNYGAEGALDLQLRFTGYNIGTLMFREIYSRLSCKLSKWWHGMPDPSEYRKNGETKTWLGAMHHAARWAIRSIIKGGIYMTPAVPFFWITRTPQTNYRGIGIHPEKGFLGYENEEGKLMSLHADEPFGHQQELAPNSPIYFVRHEKGKHVKGNTGTNIFTQPGFDPYGQTFGPADAVMNGFGKACYEAGKLTSRGARWLGEGLGLSSEPAYRFGFPYMNAVAAYTPYMWAKAETAYLWDDGRMDVAAERAADGLLKLNPGEFVQGCKEVWHAFLKKPLPDPQREKLAEWRKAEDESLPDSDTKPYIPKAKKPADFSEKAARHASEGWAKSHPKREHSMQPAPSRYTEREEQRAHHSEKSAPPGPTLH